MSIPQLVHAFYDRIWNAGDLDGISELLAQDFRFRGSLGGELHGQEAFAGYVKFVRAALGEYNCEIIDCVSESDRAFAKMRFSGRHVGFFCGYEPTGKQVSWLGAALFRFEAMAIKELWVLGDLHGLDAVLKENASPDRLRDNLEM
jgi:predicted ester cyclase